VRLFIRGIMGVRDDSIVIYKCLYECYDILLYK